MPEQAANTNNRVNPFAYFFSGADRAILKQLPKQDQKPYAWLAFYNVVIPLMLIVACVIILKVGNFSNSELNVAMPICAGLYVTCFFVQVTLVRKLINSWSLGTRFLYLSWGSIVALIPLIIYSNLQFSKTLDYLETRSLWYDFFLPLMLFTIPIGFLVAISYIIINQNKDDFYNRLKEKKKSLAIDILEKQRQQILSNFVSDSELELTVKSLNKNKDLDPEAKKIFENISSSARDSRSLEAYADYLLRTNEFQKALVYLNQAIELDATNPELWKKKIDVLRITKNFDEELQAKERYSELFKNEQFKNNLEQQIALRCVELNNISFYGSFTWHLRKNINILLGKNGYGKSHLISIILAILQEEEKTARDFTLIENAGTSQQPYIKIKLASDYPVKKEEIESINAELQEKIKERTDFISKWRKSPENNSSNSNIRLQPLPHTEIDDDISTLLSKLELAEGVSNFSRVGIKNSYGKIPILAIPDSRFINKSNTFTVPVIDEKAKKLLENGAYHFINEVPYETAIQNFLNTIAVIYTDEPDVSKKFNDPIFKLIDRVFKSLTGQEFVWKEIKRTQDNSGFIITVRTEGASIDLPIQKVSQGTLSVISMIGLIFQYLSLRYPETDRETLASMQAIVFIDEIDAHLHPSWQQKIIRILRNEFPNIQFIISAHSPLIVAGCMEEEVSVLRKKENGFAIETIDSNLIGKPIADIFRMVFEIEEKDEMYLELAALLPFRKSIEAEVHALKIKSSRTDVDNKRMDELGLQMEKFIYVDQFSSLMSGYEEKEALKEQNEGLRLEQEKLKAELNSFHYSDNKK